MLQKIIGTLCIAACVAAFTACGGEEPPDVASLSFTSNDVVDGTLYVIKDTGVFVGVAATDVNGAPVGEDRLEQVDWTTDDPSVLQVHSLGATGVIDGQLDWFDTLPDAGDGGADAGTGGMDDETPAPDPYEPGARVTATLGDASASIDVIVILNGSGSWIVTLDDGTSLTLDLEQNGRTVTHAATGASGQIVGSSFSLNFAGYLLNGAFVDRNMVEGDYTKPGGETGTWNATRP